MPQQLKQFVENSKKQREFKTDATEPQTSENMEEVNYDPEIDFGKHFLSFSTNMSSEDENGRMVDSTKNEGNTALNMSLHEWMFCYSNILKQGYLKKKNCMSFANLKFFIIYLKKILLDCF